MSCHVIIYDIKRIHDSIKWDLIYAVPLAKKSMLCPLKLNN